VGLCARGKIRVGNKLPTLPGYSLSPGLGRGEGEG
jgi:hypothetical protein